MKIPSEPQRRGFVEEQIDEAIARGEFQNLRGKGKPLNLHGDLSDRKVMRDKLQHDAGFNAPWADVGREIDHGTARVENALKLAFEFRRAGLNSPKSDKTKIEADFQGQLRAIEEQIVAVNSLVLKHNLLLPRELPRLHRRKLYLGEVLGKLGFSGDFSGQSSVPSGQELRP